MARDCLRYGRSPHVVGAGIGLRCQGEAPDPVPTLTLLVDASVPHERLVSVVKRASGGQKQPDFDVLNVGKVTALDRLG
jgi:hypothetical protein